MVLLPRLIQNIDDFYDQATELVAKAQTKKPQTLEEWKSWTMPEEPEEGEEGEEGIKNPPHFDELMDIARRVDDPGLSQQLEILAELYRRAIQIGGGYASIARAINELKNQYSDGTSSDIEFILNGMIKELAKHAGGVNALAGGDNPRFVQQLAQLRQDILARTQEAQSEALDAYQEDISVPGASSEGEGELAESGLDAEPEAVSAAALGFGGDKDDPKANRGWHTTGKIGAYKNWSEYYDNEREAYEADLAAEKNPATINILKQLISLLTSLSSKTAEALKLSNDLKVVPDPAGQERLEKIRDDLRALKKSRALLKARIRNTEIDKDQQKLSAELASSKDFKEKELIKQKMALNELSKSKDIGKAKERNYRLALIHSMSGGNFPGPATLQDMLRKIEEASKLKISIEDYRKQQAAKLKSIKEMGERGLKFTEKGGDFASVLVKLKQHVPNVKMGDKKYVIDKWRDKVIASASEKEKTTFKPHLDALAAAKKSGDKAAITAAMSALYNALNSSISQFIEHASAMAERVSNVDNQYKDVTEFRKKLEALNKQGLINKPTLTPDEKAKLFNQLQELIAQNTELANRSYPNPLTGREREATKALLFNMLSILTDKLRSLGTGAPSTTGKKVKLEEIDPETGEVTYQDIDEKDAPKFEGLPYKRIIRGHMNKKQRKAALEQIEKQAYVATHAEEISSLLNDASLNSIEDPEEYAHQVFQKMLAQIGDKLKNIT